MDETIGFYEAEAVLLATRTFRDKIKDRRVYFFIDNAGDYFSFVTAQSRHADTAKIITNVIVELRELMAKPFFEYILSQDNPADWTTRHEYLHLLKHISSCFYKPKCTEAASIEHILMKRSILDKLPPH